MLEKTLILGFGTTGKSFVDYLLSQDQQIKVYDSNLQNIPNVFLKSPQVMMELRISSGLGIT